MKAEFSRSNVGSLPRSAWELQFENHIAFFAGERPQRIRGLSGDAVSAPVAELLSHDVVKNPQSLGFAQQSLCQAGRQKKPSEG